MVFYNACGQQRSGLAIATDEQTEPNTPAAMTAVKDFRLPII